MLNGICTCMFYDQSTRTCIPEELIKAQGVSINLTKYVEENP